MTEGERADARTPARTGAGIVVVLCALPVEYKAVRALLIDTEEQELPGGALFEEGILPDSPWKVAVGELGEGTIGAGVLAERAMNFFAPDLVLFVGVAGALKDDLLVGDVVVASRVDAYAGGKAAEDFLARPRTWDAPFRIHQRARSVARTGWLPPGHTRVDGQPPTVHFKPIAAGDVVLASRDSPLYAHLRLHYNDAVAIEMEGAGLAQAAHLNDSLPALVIRGISDTTDPDKDTYDRAGWQSRAAAHAASFAAALLRTVVPRGLSRHRPGDVGGSHDGPAERERPSSLPPEPRIVVGRAPQVASDFQDRPLILPRIEQALTKGGTAVVTQVVSGDGGVGKTQIAAAIFEGVLRRGDANVLAWITASTRDRIVSTYAELLGRINPSRYAESPEHAASALLAWLGETTTKWFLVLDDLFVPDILVDLWPAGPSGRTIVTTRSRNTVLDEDGRVCIDVGVFEKDESLAYLSRRLRKQFAHKYALSAAPELAAALGHLPLALAQAASVILDRGLTCADYLQRFQDRSQRLDELFPRRSANPLHRTVSTTWSLASDLANQVEPVGASGRLLAVISLLDPNGVPECILMRDEIQEWVRHRLGAVAPSWNGTEIIHGAIRALHKLSLITHSPGDDVRSVRMHALAQRATREDLEETTLLEVMDVCSRALIGCWDEVAADSDSQRALRDNALAFAEIARDELWKSSAYAILWKIGESLGDSGLVTEALKHWTKVADEAQVVFGERSPVVLEARVQVAGWTGRAGNARSAASQFEALWRTASSSLGSKTSLALAIRRSEGYWLGRAGHVPGAVRLLSNLVTTYRDEFGGTHPETLAARATLAHWLGRAGRPLQAVGELESVVAEREKTLGRDHRDTLSARHSVAYWRGPAGDPAGAASALEDVLRDRVRILGPKHPDTMTTRHELARWRGKSGHPLIAAEGFERLLIDRLEVLGADHPDTLATRGNMGLWQAEAGNPEYAVRVFENLVDDRMRVQGPDHPETLTSRHHLACLRGRTNGPDEAITGLTQVLGDRLRVLGADHPDTLITRFELARWRATSGDVASAKEMLNGLASDQRRILGSDHSETARTVALIEELGGKEHD